MGGSGDSLCVLCGAIIPGGSEKCPRCGTGPVQAESAKTSPETIARSSTSDVLKEGIPRTALPDIKNTCPLCASTVGPDETRCTRCGVPLKNGVAQAQPIIATPSSAQVAATAPAQVYEAKERERASIQEKSSAAPMMSESATQSERPPEIVTMPHAVNMAKASPGLVNGRGMTNGTGLTNGRGMVNGTGLVNGTGMVNGAGKSSNQAEARGEKGGHVRRWQFLAVLAVIAIVLPTFLFLSYTRSSEPGADGDFGEWAGVMKFGMQAPASMPEVTVEEWAVRVDGQNLYLYLQTGSNVMGTSDVSSFFLFIDSDGNPDTGYSVSGMGANYMLELHGWDQKVQSASLMRFDSSYDQLNWTSWTPLGYPLALSKSDKLEAQAELPMELDSGARFMLLAQNNLPDRSMSMSYPVPAQGGVLIVIQGAGSSVDPLTGVVPISTNVSLARLTLKCEGASGVVSGISPEIDRAGSASPISDISLSPGESKTVDIYAVTSGTSAQSLVSAWVTKDGVTSTFSDVFIMGEPVRAYVSAPPPSVKIDGAFGDWEGRTVYDQDGDPVPNQDIDITRTGAVNTTSVAAFYVGVRGEIFQGEFVPAVRGKPTSQGGGGSVTPHRKTGEDILRVYIDSDMSNTTGELVKRSAKEIGADYLIKIDGMYGKVVSQVLMRYTSGSWVQVFVDVDAMADSQRIEMSVPSSAIGGSSSLVAIIETTDWRGRSDWSWAGGALDPWVIDATGTTYMSNDGAVWSYLGMPTIEPGDRIVDIALSIGSQGGDIFLVTNTGRTYYWVPGTSTNWEVGQTIPIDTANYSEAVSMAFYQNAGAWLLTRDGAYFWLMDAHKDQKEWTFQAVVGEGLYTGFTDIVYSDGTMYALRSAPNSPLNYSNNGNFFTSITSPTGSASNHTQMTYINNGPGPDDDVLYVLCQNGNIRYSSNGGTNWSALGNLPAPTGGNTSKYVALGIDPAGYMWVVTDTGFTYRSTSTITYNSFVYTGRAPLTSIVAILPTTAIPEFSTLAIPIISIVLMVSIVRIGRKFF